MVSSSKDVLVIGGLVALGLIAYKGIGGFLNNFKAPELPSIPNINLSLGGIDLGSTNIDTKYPDIPQTDKSVLETIQNLGGLVNLQQEKIFELFDKLTPLGTSGNPADAPTSPTFTDIVLNDKTLSEAQKRALLDAYDPYDPSLDPNSDPNKFQPKEGSPPYDPYNPKGVQIDGKTFTIAPNVAYGEIIPKSEVDNTQMTKMIEQELQKTSQAVINDKSVNITGSFGESAVGQQGFTINENPIDTFSEVLKYFPNLSASQASDFLNETQGKILPSQVPFIDADIKNIVAGFYGGGQNQSVPVDTYTSPDELKMQELISAQFTCKEYGLNCNLVDGLMA